jgi:hypothetical protein
LSLIFSFAALITTTLHYWDNHEQTSIVPGLQLGNLKFSQKDDEVEKEERDVMCSSLSDDFPASGCLERTFSEHCQKTSIRVKE